MTNILMGTLVLKNYSTDFTDFVSDIVILLEVSEKFREYVV